MSGALMRDFRLRAGLTQVELAKKLGVTQAAVTQVETGRVAFSQRYLVQLDAIASEMGVPLRATRKR